MMERFVAAQEQTHARALAELRAGAKRSHWMWYVFPQLAGLGHSAMARHYALRDIDEARAWLAHPLLGPRLAECTDAMLGWAGRRSAEAILGPVDALKFASSMTLFEAAGFETAGPEKAGGAARYGTALDAFCGGQRDPRTLALLAAR